MINLKTKINIHNRFDAVLIGPDGNIKQKAKAENVVVNSFYDSISQRRPIRYLLIGDGVGVPSVDDTKLFNYRHYQIITSGENRDNTYTKELCTQIASVEFPADASHVGNYTEVALASYLVGSGSSASFALISHANFTDAEGNPIVIEKTDLDVLKITYTVYIVPSAPDYMYLNDKLDFAKFIFNDDKFDNATWTSIIGNVYISTSVYATGSVYASTALLNAAGTPKLNITDRRISTTELNNNYINSLVIQNVGNIDLPNASVVAPYRTSKHLVGRGDGVSTTFDTPIPDFVLDSDELYVNDVLQTRGVDYTIDNLNNNLNWSSAYPPNYIRATRITESDFFPSYKYAWLIPLMYAGTAAVVNSDHPTEEYHFKSPIKINRWQTGSFYIRRYPETNYPAPTSGFIVLECTNSAGEWVEVVREEVTSATSIPIKLYEFDTYVSDKWRLSFIATDAPLPWCIYYNVNYGPSISQTLYYEGPPITFTNPPPADALITLSAIVDRPFKTADYVVDITGDIFYH